MIHGFAYFDVQRFNTSLATASNGTLTGTVDFLARMSKIDALNDSAGGNFSPFGAPAGSAFAMDLGVAGRINEFLTFGMSVTDIGSMTWSSNVRQRSVDTMVVVDDLFSTSQRDALENAMSAKEQPGSSFSSSLPTQFRLGFAVEIDKLPSIVHFPGQLTVAVDYNQGFHDTYASTTAARVSLGAEYAPARVIPIRMGVSFGGTDRVNMAFGFGIHLGSFQFDLASENVSWLFDPKSFSYGSIAMGMRVCI
jgi:hypothetical protein